MTVDVAALDDRLSVAPVMLVSQIDGRSKAVAMTAVATQNVYLLGAGFSKAVSPAMPVMPELAAQVLDELGLDEKMLRPFNGDLESWLSFLSSPQPWLTEAENLRNRASYFDVSSAIFTVINQDEQVALSQPAPIWLQRLVWTMSEQSAVVLTLNYDLLLERVAMVVGRARAFSHLYAAPLTERMRPGTGYMLSRSEAAGTRISLHKLHGSTNWYGAAAGAESAPVCVVRDSGTWQPDDQLFSPPDWYADLRPMIIPPVAVKAPFYANQALRAGWIRAAQALQEASKLTIIGYSLPVTDNSTAALIAVNLHPSCEVTVVDLSEATADRVASLLPNHEVRRFVGLTAVHDYVDQSCHQHVEWGVDQLEDGSEVPNVLVNGLPLSRDVLPDLAELPGPDGWNPEQRFARWVGTQWPDVTSQGLLSKRWGHPGGFGFAQLDET